MQKIFTPALFSTRQELEERERERERERKTETETGRQTDRLTERQTDRQRLSTFTLGDCHRVFWRKKKLIQIVSEKDGTTSGFCQIRECTN